MTEAPILTAKQKKSSLSAKKARTKETIKNSLYTPYKQYWPCINENHYDSLKESLDQYLPELLPEKVKVPWSDLKGIQKKNRKKIRQKLLRKTLLAKRGTLERQPINKDGLVLGVNDVSKALETGKASHILLSDDIEPKLLVQHIIDQAVLNKVPILVVPDLRNILKQKCGIASIALALSNNEKYACLQTKIEEISIHYPIPTNHIHYNRLQSIKMPSENKQATQLTETDTNILQVNDSKNTENKNTIADQPITALNKSLYLIRTDKERRVFIPQQKKDQPTLMQLEKLPFSFNNNPELYKALKVKRSKQNKNRLKVKINALKKQKLTK
ncbi:uncharacterized protein LOC143206797 [Rhynchophorus ferrugineus]|uniref:Ribosomal protein eL8/eL30/eS12/Gadd45 domain-containing protein n=1 Tax=Rhynchophorus ferrugineus TaxID=354439 RepID=A0A834HQ76_RHYFE|nr:hypothetical protein GWI33_020140 [Rhynchophorus ferrugineus]